MANETPVRSTQRKAMFLSCGLCLSVLVWALFSACPDPAKKPKTLNVELIYSSTFGSMSSPAVQVFSADGKEVMPKQELNSTSNSGTQGRQIVEVDCSGQLTRSKEPTHFLHAKGSTTNGQTLEGKVALSKEICDAGLAKIVMMIPERVGQLIARRGDTSDAAALIEVAGVFGHASAMFGDGRILVMGGVSRFSPKQGVLPSIWRMGDLYGGLENSEMWLYDPEAATLRSGKVDGLQGLLGRAFHSLTAQGNNAWAVGGWLPTGGGVLNGWLPTASFALPVVLGQDLYDPSEASLLVAKSDEKLALSSFRSVGHLAFAVNTDATTSPAIALVGGRQPHPNDDPRLPPSPIPPPQSDGCGDGEQRVFLTMHAASLLPNGQDLVVTGGLWTRVDGSPLPPRFSNVIWRASLAQLQGQATFCAKISPSESEGIRVVFANPKDGEAKSLFVVLGGLPVGMIGHSMTLVGRDLLVYGGISLPRDVWPWRDGEAVSDEDIYQKGFGSVRESAFWLSVKDDGKFDVTPVQLQEGKVNGEEACGASGLGARAMHQATRLLDGRILLSGGLRCLPRSPGVPLQGDCAVGGLLHPRPVLLYTPKDSVARPSSLIYRCIRGGGSHASQNPPIPRLFHTATQLPSGRVLLWGGLTSDGSGLVFKQQQKMPVEVFSPPLGEMSLPTPQENNQEGIGPDAGTPEGIEPVEPEDREPPNPEETRPDATPPAQTLMRHFAVKGNIKNVRVLVGSSEVIHLFFALQGSIERIDHSPIYSEGQGAGWSLVRMRMKADFSTGTFNEWDNAIVIPKITNAAQWDVALQPNNTNFAFVAIRCSDVISTELLVDPKEPERVQLCGAVMGGAPTSGIAVLRLGSLTKPNGGTTYVYAPLSAWFVQGDLSFRRLRIRDGAKMEIALIGAGRGAVVFHGVRVRWNDVLPEGSGFSLGLQLEDEPLDVVALSMVKYRPLSSGGLGEVVDYAWLEDAADTRCFLASVQGTGSFEASRSDASSPPLSSVAVGGFENISMAGVWVSCYAGTLDRTLTRRIVLHDANVSKRPKRLLALQKGAETRLYFSFDDMGTVAKPHVFVLAATDMRLLDAWDMSGGAQSEMVSVSDSNGGVPIYLAQFSLGLPWDGVYPKPSLSLYAPELSSTPQGYAFPMIKPSPVLPDYWKDPFVDRSSLASKGGMVAMAGILTEDEGFDVSVSSSSLVEIQGRGLFLWTRQSFHDRSPPTCVPGNMMLAAQCSCSQHCSGCCGPLGICRQTGQSRLADPLPFYCGMDRQMCTLCDKRKADGCDPQGKCVCGSASACTDTQICGANKCGDCKPEEVSISINGTSSISGPTRSVAAGIDLQIEIESYRHRIPDLPVMPFGTKQALVVGITREGYGTEAWGCAYLEDISTMTCGALKTRPTPLDRGGRPLPIKAPLWISNGGEYRVIAKAMVGAFASCEDAMQAFEALDMANIRPIWAMAVQKPICIGMSGFSLDKAVLNTQGTQPNPQPIVSVRKGDSIYVSFHPFFYANQNGDTAIHYALFDRLGRILLETQGCYAVAKSSEDYCTAAKQMLPASVVIASGSSAAPGDYFFRVDLKSGQTCSAALPPMEFKRNATIGTVRLLP